MATYQVNPKLLSQKQYGIQWKIKFKACEYLVRGSPKPINSIEQLKLLNFRQAYTYVRLNKDLTPYESFPKYGTKPTYTPPARRRVTKYSQGKK